MPKKYMERKREIWKDKFDEEDESRRLEQYAKKEEEFGL